MSGRFKDIKLLVIDIDGTLVDSEGNIGEKTLRLSKELKKHNILCTLSSARSFYYSKHIADELEIDIPFVTLDGSLIKDRKNNTLYKAVIKQEIVVRAIQLAEANYGKIALCSENHIYITPRNSVVREYSKLNAPFMEIDNIYEAGDILEILIYCEDKASIKAIRNGFSFFQKRSILTNITKSPTYDYYLLTIKRKGSDKLNSVRRLVQSLGLKKKNVAVIGDWHNDMPLFKYGAYNIAVQNAIPELKRNANYVTRSTNNEDAVGEVLELLLNSILTQK